MKSSKFKNDRHGLEGTKAEVSAQIEKEINNDYKKYKLDYMEKLREYNERNIE